MARKSTKAQQNTTPETAKVELTLPEAQTAPPTDTTPEAAAEAPTTVADILAGSEIVPDATDTQGIEDTDASPVEGNADLADRAAKRRERRAARKARRAQLENFRLYDSNLRRNIFDIGADVSEAKDTEQVLTLAGLDWAVVKRPLLVDVDGTHLEIEGQYATTRSDDNSVLGIVGRQFTALQNREAFNWLDTLLGGACIPSTAGYLHGGRRVWVSAKMAEQTKLLDDPVDTYIFISNSHDGSGALQVGTTPIRIVCQNTLNLACATASRSWTARHYSGLSDKMAEAARALELTNTYMAALQAQAEIMAAIKVTPKTWDALVATLFPEPKKGTDRRKDTVNERRVALTEALNVDDLANYRGTAWGAINAVADYVDHANVKRESDVSLDRRFEKVVDGHPLVDRATSFLLALR